MMMRITHITYSPVFVSNVLHAFPGDQELAQALRDNKIDAVGDKIKSNDMLYASWKIEVAHQLEPC